MQKIKSKKYEINTFDKDDEPFVIWIQDRASQHAIRIDLKKKEITDFWNEWEKVHHRFLK